MGHDKGLDEIVYRRHSTRMFVPDRPIPPELRCEALTLASRAPSNSNVQPWRLFLASGRRRDRLAAALSAEAGAYPPAAMGLPESFSALRRAFLPTR
jgi:nitroreductase